MEEYAVHQNTVTSTHGTGLRIRIKTIGESTESLIRRALRTVANRLINRAHNLHITTILITSRPGVWHDFKIKLSADNHEQKEIDRPKKPSQRDQKTAEKWRRREAKTGRRISSVCSTRKTDPSNC